MSSDLKSQFEQYSLEFSKLQNSINELITSRSKLETQYQENKIVNEEFETLNEDSKIYKLIGSILLPQDYQDANMNINKRIEFIENEINRVETKIKNEETEMENIRNKLLEVRSKLGA
ncbi:unnamed protein product [Candida verbasci]|uniref:Prefoldin subunit 6 n=1 Tax=Candida verbasci TaxID=1227364 RepID=A0A9W4TV73_9ASCO|nr:unnamed protein product [Candida verbasci]